MEAGTGFEPCYMAVTSYLHILQKLLGQVWPGLLIGEREGIHTVSVSWGICQIVGWFNIIVFFYPKAIERISQNLVSIQAQLTMIKCQMGMNHRGRPSCLEGEDLEPIHTVF